jgi:putative transposase
MSQYRRYYIPGGTYFFTLVTYQRNPLFSEPENVSLLRAAITQTRKERPFEITASVVLHEHLHFLWTLPPDDADYSQRISRFKVLFTRSLRGKRSLPVNVSASRRRHRESDVWQRRFWEHTILDENDLQKHLDYIHYNPVKHGLVSCPHLWTYSSFHRWVERDKYQLSWGCCCDGRQTSAPDFAGMSFGE